MRVPETAMVLAAGHGKRMRPLSAHDAEAAGRGRRPRADRPLPRRAGRGRRRRRRSSTSTISPIASRRILRRAPRRRSSSPTSATTLLETGGGVKQGAAAARRRAVPPAQFRFLLARGRAAQPRLAGRRPGTTRAWTRCCSSPRRCRPIGYSGRGDFMLDKDGRLARRPERTVAPFVYAGAAILHRASSPMRRTARSR